MPNAIQLQKSLQGKLAFTVKVGRNAFTADVSEALGGDDLGPDPHDLLDASLGACTALTVLMVARRKQMPVEDIQVTITHTESAGLYILNRQIKFIGPLSEEQRDYLLGIANKCPIHKAMQGRFEVVTVLAAPEA
ncbi:MAG: OsmC family protein [Pseudomonadota bacterium]